MELVKKIKGLKPSTSFLVKSRKERNEAKQVGKSLRQLGDIDFIVTTREVGDGQFLVFAGKV